MKRTEDIPPGVVDVTTTHHNRGATLPERIERIVRDWPEWSPAERRRMDELVEEVLQHGRDGGGNAFIRGFWERVITKEIGS